MSETFCVRGVPKSIATDGWWLDAPDRPTADAGPARIDGPFSLRAGGLLVLIGLADMLFWGHAAGLSLALFAWAIFAVAALGVRPRRGLFGPAVLLALGSLPVIDLAQALSIALLLTALLSALVWLRLPEGGIAPVLLAATRLLGRLPLAGLVDALRGVGRLASLRSDGPVLRNLLRNWAFPIGGTAVFTALLLDANPVIERLLSSDLDLAEATRRGLFWLGIGLMAWPLIDAAPPAAQAMPKLPRLPRFGINATSTLRALWMFNLLIGVQTLMDLSIFLGGAALPNGMSHAAYAHRGAYPLLATALLAGALALSARLYLREHRALKPLLLLWLVQNVVLSLSAVLRLHLYVEAYGLTYLRIDAAIWMGLVALGRMLTGWQVWRGWSNGWLMLRAFGLGLAVLYACSFVNFAALIAQTNLAQGRVAQWGYRDWCYLDELGPLAAGAIVEALAQDPALKALAFAQGFRPDLPQAQSWREWGFRNWHVLRYLDAVGQQDGRR